MTFAIPKNYSEMTPPTAARLAGRRHRRAAAGPRALVTDCARLVLACIAVHQDDFLSLRDGRARFGGLSAAMIAGVTGMSWEQSIGAIHELGGPQNGTRTAMFVFDSPHLRSHSL